MLSTFSCSRGACVGARSRPAYRQPCSLQVSRTGTQVRKSRNFSCSATYMDASDSETESSTSQHIRSHSALPELEHASEDEGLLPVRHPGSFPYAGVHTDTEQEIEDSAFDPLRDGPLRYLGYSNELGEAFAAWLPPFGVPASYCIALGYVMIDTYDKAAEAHAEAQAAQQGASGTEAAATDIDWEAIVKLLTSERALDTLLWQVLASVVVPGFTIHQVVYFVHMLMENTMHLGNSELTPVAVAAAVGSGAQLTHQSVAEVARAVDKTVPTLAGIAAIPLIVHPIDNAVHMLLNTTLRPYMRNVICDGARGRDAGLNICEVALSDDESGLEGDLRGPAVSSFDYGACLEREGCSVVTEYYRHQGDAKPRNVKLAVAKAVLLSAPVAWVLLATQSLN